MTALADLDGPELWRSVRAASRGESAGAAGRVAALSAVAGRARLGWVEPPAWNDIVPTLARLAEHVRAAGPAGTLFVGTGGWISAVRTVGEAVGRPHGLRAVDSLDPAALLPVVPALRAGRWASLAISGSGTTLETRLLAASVAAAHRARRGGPAAPTLWLTDRVADGEPGVAPLSLSGRPDVCALFGAPLTTAFLLPAALLAGAVLADAYAEFAAEWEAVAAAAAARAAELHVDGAPAIILRPPADAGAGLRAWLRQLGRQSLCSKSARFQPRVGVGEPPAGVDGAVQLVDLVTGCRTPLARAMAVMHAASVFVACLGLRAGVRISEHPAVDDYKGRLGASSDPEVLRPERPERLVGIVAGWLARRPDLAFAHLVGFGRTLSDGMTALAAKVAHQSGRPCEGHEGSAWNHHSYQAVHGDQAAGVVVLTAARRPTALTGDRALDRALLEQARGLRAIADATHYSLAARSLRLELA